MSTGIEWTDVTWNPVRGCSRTCAAGTSQSGCGDGTGGGCYAEQQAGRIVRMGKGKPTPYDGLVRETATGWRWTGKTAFDAKKLVEPLKWKKTRRVFVDSMSDLFHDGFTNEQIAAVFGVMAAAPQHTFQVLTKRAKRMREWFEWAANLPRQHGEQASVVGYLFADAIRESNGAVNGFRKTTVFPAWPLPNVWIGVSVEDQGAADERIPELLRTPAAVRFLSCEPLLGPVRLPTIHIFGSDPKWEGPRIGWLISGCESGPGARPCEVDWLRSLRDQCAEAGVAFFLKQARATHPTWESWNAEQESPETGGIASTAPPPIAQGPGSKRKPGGIIGTPYLDGVRHVASPKVAP